MTVQRVKQKQIARAVNINTGKAKSRRALLQGAGAALALPMLDAMTPAFANTSAPIHRFQTVYIPNGMAMEYRTTDKTGRDYELTPELATRSNYKDKMRLIGG